MKRFSMQSNTFQRGEFTELDQTYIDALIEHRRPILEHCVHISSFPETIWSSVGRRDVLESMQLYSSDSRLVSDITRLEYKLHAIRSSNRKLDDKNRSNSFYYFLGYRNELVYFYEKLIEHRSLN